MAEYIKKEDAIHYLMINMNWHDEDGYPVDDWDEKLSAISDLINGVHAADVVERKTGEWITKDVVKVLASGKVLDGFCQCDMCGRIFPFHYSKYDFCPNCGAEMLEDVEP